MSGNTLLYSLVLLIIANIVAWMQVNLQFIYEWWDKRPLFTIMTFSIPCSALFYYGWKYLVEYFDGNLWPPKLVSFGIGVIIFAILSYLMKGETIDRKTILCLFLSVCIILIQTLCPGQKQSGKIKQSDQELQQK